MGGQPAWHLQVLVHGALLLLLLQPARPQDDASSWQEGLLGQLGYGSTYTPAQGACGYGDLPTSAWPFGGLAAIDPATSPFAVGPQEGCGICIEVQCADASQCDGAPSQSQVVLVTDHCTGCGTGAVFLAPSAYSKLVVSKLGQVNGRFRRVNCDPSGNMVVHVDQYRTAAGGWLRLALLDVAGSGDIKSVDLASSERPDSWLPMQRTFGASWQLSSLPRAPLDLRAADGSGQQVVARRALQQAGQTGNFPTSAQFQATVNLANALRGGRMDATPPAAAAQAPSPLLAPPAAGATTFETIFGAVSPAQVQALPPPAPFPEAPPSLPAPAPSPEAPPSPPAPAPSPEAPPSPPAPAPSPEAPPGPPLASPIPAIPAPTPAPEVEPAPSVLLVSPEPSEGALIAPIPSPESPAAAALTLSLTLPAPTQTAPIVVDTRPPRPPGIGPSVTPAPVSFIPAADLPTLPALPASPGPATADQLRAAASLDPATCLTLGDILARIPEASNWTQLLKSVGLDVLLRDKKARVTLLVPVNSALNAAIDARPLRNESTLTELILNAPEIVNPLVGYHVLPGLWPSSALQLGTKVDTSDTIDKVNRLQLTAQGSTSLQGIGTSASILQPDIVACGPSVVHIVDQVLLPFTFDQAALDAITATQVPQTPQPAGK